MPWLGDLGRVRVSAPIVFLGAFAVIALVKLTSLLPEKYYFRFSGLVSSASSPFIVQPPGVTFSKLCALVEKNRINDASFTAGLDCPKPVQSGGPSYGRINEDAIYRIAFATDAEVRGLFERAASGFVLKPLAGSKIEEAFSYASNLGRVVENIESAYRSQVSTAFTQLFRREFGRQFLALPSDKPQRNVQPVAAKGVSAESRAVLLEAHQAMIPALTRSLAKVRLRPITKAKLDEFTRNAYSRNSVVEALANYYTNQIADDYSLILKAGFAQAGLDRNKDRKKIDRAVLDEGMEPYVISALVRIVPVLMFGVLVGIFWGATEINSVSVAAALAAFLLAWPVILLWDQVVGYDWQDKRHIFFAFYILYVLSFFITARLGARLGVLLRGGLQRRAPDVAVPAQWNISGFGGKLAKELLVAGLVNVLFYVGNAFVAIAG